MKHGIMPVGFVSAQLQPQRKLPTGHITFLLTDLEGSTELLGRLDDRYAALLADVRRLVRAAVRSAGGREASARGDDVFAVFERAPAALEAALAIQRAMGRRRLARRARRAAADRPASRASRAHRYRATSALSSTPPRICRGARARGSQSAAVRAAVGESLADGVSLEQPRRLAIPRLCPDAVDSLPRQARGRRRPPTSAPRSIGHPLATSARCAVGGLRSAARDLVAA